MKKKYSPPTLPTEKILALEEDTWKVLAEHAKALTAEERAQFQAMRTGSPSDADDPGYEVVGSVAVVSFSGVVCKKLSFWGWLFGRSACTQDLLEGANNAVAAGFKNILVRIDSPGGGIDGCAEAFAGLLALRSKARIWAFADDRMLSAAYWIGSAAQKIFANETAAVGSIGVLCSVTSMERMAKNMGVETEVFRSTPAKAPGAGGMALTDSARADIQHEVDAVAARFTAAVAAGRGVSDAEASRLSDGKCYIGAEAQTRGLVDGITTLQALIGQMEAEEPFIPPVPVAIDVEGPCDDEDEDGDEPETTCAEAVAHPPALKEAKMSAETAPDLTKLAAAFEALSGQVTALKTENEALKARVDTATSGITAISTERELDKLLFDARESVKLTAANEKWLDPAIRAAFAESPKAAAAFIAGLPALGKGKGSIMGGTLAPAAALADPKSVAATTPVTASNIAKHRFNVYGAALLDATDESRVAFRQTIEWVAATEKESGEKFPNAAEAFKAYAIANRAAA